MARSNGLLLSFFGGVASEFQDLAGEVFEDGGGEGTGSDTDLLGVAALPEHASAAGDWEGQAGLA